MSLRDALNEILGNYEFARHANNKTNPLPMLRELKDEVHNIIHDDFPDMLIQHPAPHITHRFPCQAWITVLHPDITESPKKGCYVAYLIASYKPSNVILCFMSAVNEVEIQVEDDHDAIVHELHKRSQEISRSAEKMIRRADATGFLKIDNYVGFLHGNTIRDHGNTRALYYEKAIAFGKSYGNILPEEEVLINDLKTITNLYARMVGLGIVPIG